MNRPATLALTPLSIAFGIGVRIRNGLYRHGFLKSYDVGAPVISIGNLTTGGTGKTPMVEWISTQLAAEGHRVCIITRGYRRKSSGRLLVADNERVLSNVDEAGDEPFLLAQKLAGKAAVICDGNRVAAAQWAIANLGTEVIVLDDAFQHQRIKRTLNLLLIDATNPFGNSRLLPAGILREPQTELARADCIIITRANESTKANELRTHIRGITPQVPFFTCRTRLNCIQPISRSAGSNDERITQVVAAFCGIANPNSFFDLLGREGYDVVQKRVFRDHHDYSQTDVDDLIRDAASGAAKALITTEKDAVKLAALNFSLPCYAANTSIEFDEPGPFISYVTRAAKCVTT
jgi:tetraacyldisaccharide 4'-kinase